jgi:hypothetical protein
VPHEEDRQHVLLLKLIDPTVGLPPDRAPLRQGRKQHSRTHSV